MNGGFDWSKASRPRKGTPAHVLEVAIAPKLAVDLERLLVALERRTRDTALLAISHNAPCGQIILRGVSEHALDETVTMLQRDDKIGLAVGAPQVAYRETLLRKVEIDETHKTQTGGTGRFAKVKIVVEPNAPGAGSAFATKIAGGAVPEAYMPGISRGIESVMGSGVLAGFPVVDVQVPLIDGAFHDTDSSALAFEIVARAALRRALKEGGSVLLEPIMSVEITTPEAYTGFVMGDLRARRGEAQGQDRRDDALVIRAIVPLANMFGYVAQLRVGTQGHGSYAMEFSHYAPLLLPDGDGPAAPAIALRG